MQAYMPPKTRRKPTDADTSTYDTQEYNADDGIRQPDDEQQVQEYHGEHVIQTCMTDIDLAGQIETRQSTSGTMNYLNGVIVHWRGRTKRLIVHTTAAGEYIALSRGNATAKYMRDIMIFYGNTQNVYHLYTDNQAAEHIATQPNMNDHSRSIDIRIHGIRQDYLDNAMRIGGVASEDNTTDILTKNLQPHLHQKHCAHLNISAHKTKHKKKGTTLTNNTIRLTSISHSLINGLIRQSLSHQEVITIPENRKLTLIEKALPRQRPSERILKSPIDHHQETPGQRVDLTDRTRWRQQAKTLTHELIKLLKVPPIPQTTVRHGLKTTREDTSEHRNNTHMMTTKE